MTNLCIVRCWMGFHVVFWFMGIRSCNRVLSLLAFQFFNSGSCILAVGRNTRGVLQVDCLKLLSDYKCMVLTEGSLASEQSISQNFVPSLRMFLPFVHICGTVGYRKYYTFWFLCFWFRHLFDMQNGSVHTEYAACFTIQ